MPGNTVVHVLTRAASLFVLNALFSYSDKQSIKICKRGPFYVLKIIKKGVVLVIFFKLGGAKHVIAIAPEL